jgi:hypothetical protein
MSIIWEPQAGRTQQQTQPKLKDRVPNATLVLQRKQESLWLKDGVYITLSTSGCTDFPIRYHDGRIGTRLIAQ